MWLPGEGAVLIAHLAMGFSVHPHNSARPPYNSWGAGLNNPSQNWKDAGIPLKEVEVMFCRQPRDRAGPDSFIPGQRLTRTLGHAALTVPGV